MLKSFVLFSILVVSLWSRENPFFPVNNEDVELTTNQTYYLPALQQASIKLPSTARTVESITVHYKNLDGSIKSKTVELQNSIDWHLPLFISQSYMSDQTHMQVNSRKKITKKKKSKSFKTLTKLKFISFKINDKKILLQTKDTMLRSFLLVRPHRIVCDFKRDTDIRSYKHKIGSSIITSIRIGTHKGYYRVVVELDGSYRYKKEKAEDGYIFTVY